MRAIVGVPLALVLAACAQNEHRNDNEVNASGKASAEENLSNSSGVPSQSNAAGVLPPANASVRYVGTWASSQATCKSKPWRFTKDSLDAKDGPRCSFYNVAKVPGGYDVAAQCPSKVPVHTDLIKLRFAESAGAMLVESNAIKPTGLISCGK
jgi:hypothetical protein